MSLLSRIRGLLFANEPSRHDTNPVQQMLDAYNIPRGTGESLVESARLNAEAQTFLAQGKWQDAYSRAERAHKLYPQGWAAAANMATALMSMNRFKEALSAYEFAMNRNPVETSLGAYRALVLVEIGRYDEGIQFADEALERHATGDIAATAWFAKATAYEKTGRHQEAARQYRRFLDNRVGLDPQSVAAINAKIARLSQSR